MPDTPETPQQPKQPEGLTAPLNIPDMPGIAPSMPRTLNWENITSFWQTIKHAESTKDPQEWQNICNSVRDLLGEWRKKEQASADKLNLYNRIRQVAMLKPEGSEERQSLLDKLEKIRLTFPPKVQRALEIDDIRMSQDPTGKVASQAKASQLKGEGPATRATLQHKADALKPGEAPVVGRWIDKSKEQLQADIQKMATPRAKITPPRTRFIDSLLQTLEGIRQGDWDAYHPGIRREIREFQLNRDHEQDVLKKQLIVQTERRDGVLPRREEGIEGNPKKADAIIKRIKQCGADLDKTPPEYEGEINRLKKEIDALERRLYGAKTAAGKADIDKKIAEIKTKLKTPEQLQSEHNAYAHNRKYDALIQFVTTITNPDKASGPRVPGMSTGPSQAARPVGPVQPYLPPGEMVGGKMQPKAGSVWSVPKPPPAPERKGPKTLLGRAHAQEDPMSVRPYGKKRGASECRIFLSMIDEGRYAQAKAYMGKPFVVNEGSIVVLENIVDIPELNGLKGVVREIYEESGRSVVVALFKNDVVIDPAIKVAFSEVRPYLV